MRWRGVRLGRATTRAAARPSRIDATIFPAANSQEYFHSDGTACGDAASTGVTTKKQSSALLQVVAALVAFAILSRVHEEYRPAEHTGRRRWIPKSLLAPGIAVGFVNVHYPVVAGFLVLHLARFGNSGPAAFSTYALLILLSRFFLGGLPDRIRPAITYYGGLVAMAVGLSVLAIGPSPPMAIASTVLRKIPSGERGSAVGALSAFVDLFVGISSFTAGAVAHRFGYSAAFGLAALSLIAAAVAGRFVFVTGQTQEAVVAASVEEEASPAAALLPDL
jgi:hypothetical protein